MPSFASARLYCVLGWWLMLLLSAPRAHALDEVKKVLILNSYHHGFQWSDDIIAGMRGELAKAPFRTSLHVEHMDTRRWYDDAAHAHLLEQLLAYKYTKSTLDLILSNDDNAYRFLLERGETLFPGAPIVFCGVNFYTAAQLKGKTNITGIVESIDTHGTLSLIRTIHPKAHKIVLLSDKTSFGRTQLEQTRPVIGAFEEQGVQFEIWDDFSLTDLFTRIETLSQETVVLYLTIVRDKDGNPFTPARHLPELVKRSPVPVYGNDANLLGLGIIGGSLKSGFYHGRDAAALAVKILSGTPVSALPVVVKQQFHPMFDFNQLRRFDVTIKKLPAHSDIINLPTEPYERFKLEIFIFSGISLCLLGAVIALSVNIALRRKSNRALELNRVRLQAVLNSKAVLLWSLDAAGRFTFSDGKGLDALGLKPGQVIGRSVFELYKDNPSIVADARRALRGEMFWTVSGIGDMHYEVLYSPLLDSAKQLIGAIGMAIDITDRKKAEQVLEKSEAYHRRLFEESPSAMFIQDFSRAMERIDGLKKKGVTDLSAYLNANVDEIAAVAGSVRIIKVNQAAVDLYRAMDRNTLLTHIDRLIIAGDHQHFIDQLTAFDSGATVYKGEGRNRTFDGRTIDLIVRKALIYPSEHDFSQVLVGLTDVTDLHRAHQDKERLELQLVQAQKMQAIGALAGGIAHDFNNLLMGMQGCVSLIQADIHESHGFSEQLDSINTYIRSASDLTKQLLGFARGGKYEIAPINLNTLIEQSMQIFSRTKKEIEIHYSLAPDLWTIEADRSQVEQVLFNLCINAWHAMHSGGRLYIGTANARLDDAYIKGLEVEPGRYVKLMVTDTGVGMDKETRLRIFEPFFTTKDKGRGTGLGLASVYGIVKNHGGLINVYSEKGHGSTFTIFLPASSKAVSSASTERSPRWTPGEGVVLLVDDEAYIRSVGVKLLEKIGYQALTAQDGKTALKMVTDNDGRIDLVILDMIMPGMGGEQTFRAMREINPTIKILLSSGYSLNGQTSKILEMGCSGFIQKPFSMHDLSEKISEILSCG